MLDIPVFHDDQHGTAIITGAALPTRLRSRKNRIAEIRVVVCGAGAAAIACAEFYVTMGVARKNIRLVDRTGVVARRPAENMNPYKARFALATEPAPFSDAVRDRMSSLASRARTCSPRHAFHMRNGPVVSPAQPPIPRSATSLRGRPAAT